MQLWCILSISWHCFSLWLEWKLTFSSPVTTAEFSNFAGILSTALSQHHLLGFEIAPLEFHYLHWLCLQWCFLRPTWLQIPGCQALGEWSWRSFLCTSSMYSCHLLISSAFDRSIPFLSFIEPIFAWNVPLVSLLLLKGCLVFPIVLFSSISLLWSLRKAFLSLLAVLWNSAFRCLYHSFSPLLFSSLFFTAICKFSSDSHFPFLHFFFFRMVLLPVSYTMSRTSAHSSSGTLSIRSSPLNLFHTFTVLSLGIWFRSHLNTPALHSP